MLQLTNKNVILGILIITAVIGVIIISNETWEQKISSKTLTIGAVLPMTGNNGFIGELIQKGALVAVHELKTKGIDVQLSVQDDATDAKQSVTATQKLLAQHVDGIFTATVQQVKPIAPLFEHVQTPLLVAWDATEYISRLGDPVFSSGFSTEGAGRSIANFATKHNIKKLAIINQQDEWSQLLADSGKKAFIANGGDIVLDESLSVDVHDYKTVISKLIATHADAVFVPLLPNYIAPFLKQARDMGYRGQILSGDGAALSELQSAGSYAEGYVFTNLWSDSTSGFVEQYQQMYGTEPEDAVFTGFGYDAVMTYYRAHQIAQQKNIDMVSAMKQVQINGANGNIDFTQGNTSAKLEKLFRVVKGEVRVIDTAF